MVKLVQLLLSGALIGTVLVAALPLPQPGELSDNLLGISSAAVFTAKYHAGRAADAVKDKAKSAVKVLGTVKKAEAAMKNSKDKPTGAGKKANKPPTSAK
ncbi:hypothetical protein H4R33_002513 [Dimargaris cristalligena]|uniref:Uncharacterized protein n=1 Tax=Dimargaris cristalligena TaxID=215637 RepID=A0A4P9ZMJ0_9FUNG|nr:hypothetical protein H4R33_002513 [Dimargaris cristalligena]RKP33510.1 hypothetical protein BJ085DRAFT_39165 [Dimargaris cristalligena]|eukprot:RKP33510.1 hypothetical protein BJ085DRAFT_39165 [Dimargaris cristalligena]